MSADGELTHFGRMPASDATQSKPVAIDAPASDRQAQRTGTGSADQPRGVSESADGLVAPRSDRGSGEAVEGFDQGTATHGLLFDCNPNPMWLYDMDTLRFLRVNEAAVQHYGYSAQQFLAMTILDLQPTLQTLEPATHGGARRRSNDPADSCRHRRCDGTMIEVALLSERVLFRGKPAGLVLVHDCGGRSRGEQAAQILKRVQGVFSQVHAMSLRLRERDELFKASCRIAVKQGGFCLAVIAGLHPQTQRLRLLASASDGGAGLARVERRIAQPDACLAQMVDGVIRERSAVVCAHKQDDAASQVPDECAPGATALLPLVVADELVAVMLLCTGDGRTFQEEELILLTQLAANLSLILDYVDKSKQLNDLRHYDAVTGLANRDRLLERAEQGLREGLDAGQGMALYLLDLERFKPVNDHLGRAAGDALLRQVGTWLTRRCGNTGLVARVGVDQFAVLLPRASGEAPALDGANRMLADLLKQPFRLQDSMLRVAAKAGIAFCPEDGRDPETLYRYAEAALKQAKQQGNRCLRYCRHMSEAAAERMSLEGRLRQALERGEFLLHYQPKLSLNGSKLSGAEALIRWQDPRGELVPPARFIPVLEETGLIHEVGAWAIHQAMSDAQRWRSAGYPAVRIAVNVSPVQLRNPGFVPQVWRSIASAPQLGADLELEITESVIMEGVQQNITVLKAIRDMGIQVAIDDFGTGFSSLSYLSRLPVDALKIDRSFVIDMTAGPEGLALVSTIINLAHSLKLKVVAEGVETEEQSRLLRLLGCDEWQGYLCSRPLPAATFETQFLRPPAAGMATPADSNR